MIIKNLFLLCFLFLLIYSIDKWLEKILKTKKIKNRRIYKINFNYVFYKFYFTLLFLTIITSHVSHNSFTAGIYIIISFLIIIISTIFFEIIFEKIIFIHNKRIIRHSLFKKEIYDIHLIEKIIFKMEKEESSGITIKAKHIYIKYKNNLKRIEFIYDLEGFINHLIRCNKKIIIENREEIYEFINKRLQIKKNNWISEIIISILLYILIIK